MWRGSLVQYSILFNVFASCILYGVTDKVYRDDYFYNAKNDAFYKLHIESVSMEDAKKVCEVEGANLMMVSSIYDTVFVHGLLKEYPDLGNYVWVADDDSVHESVEDELIFSDYANNDYPDEYPKCSVINRSGLILKHICHRNNLPFVCKVLNKDILYDDKCKVHSSGYKYFENVGSCYKIPRIAYTWNQAYTECRSEGAHLVVINSEAERAAVQSLFTPAMYLQTSHSMYYYIAGIRAKTPYSEPRVFLTIFNQTLEEAGFAEWSATEPNNLYNNENCGSIYESDGKYNDQNCDDIYGFICEKEIHV